MMTIKKSPTRYSSEFKESIKETINDLLLDFNMAYSEAAVDYLLNEAVTLYGEERPLDKFLDMFETVQSFCKLNGENIITLDIVKRIRLLIKAGE